MSNQYCVIHLELHVLGFLSSEFETLSLLRHMIDSLGWGSAGVEMAFQNWAYTTQSLEIEVVGV
jgi:hypothetical protein